MFRVLQGFISFIAIVLAYSCNNTSTTETEREVKKQQTLQLIRIEQPVNGAIFSQSEAVEISYKLLDELSIPDSAILFVDSRRIVAMGKNKYKLNTHQLSLGNHQVRITAWKEGQRQTASVGIRIKANKPPVTMKYRVVKTYPHDIEAYTQGLFYYKGQLIESTGQKGSSSLRRVDLSTGKVLQSVNLESQYFGEGSTYINGEIYQITWTSRKGFVYNPETFNLVRTFDYLTQGWGLTTKDDTLIMSDGSNTLYFLEPKSFTELKRIEVYDNNGPVSQLNELEYIDGKVYANVYQTDMIVIIDPSSGIVEAQVDFTGLLKPSEKNQNIDVFNGIAWDCEGKRLFVTGKNWPKLFHVEIY
jgi:glutamine cyclotransferase